MNGTITKEMLTELNILLAKEGCSFRYVVCKYYHDGSINTIEREIANNKWIDSAIINTTDEFYTWLNTFFSSYGIELSYNNTRSICWAK